MGLRAISVVVVMAENDAVAGRPGVHVVMRAVKGEAAVTGVHVTTVASDTTGAGIVAVTVVTTAAEGTSVADAGQATTAGIAAIEVMPHAAALAGRSGTTVIGSTGRGRDGRSSRTSPNTSRPGNWTRPRVVSC